MTLRAIIHDCEIFQVTASEAAEIMAAQPDWNWEFATRQTAHILEDFERNFSSFSFAEGARNVDMEDLIEEVRQFGYADVSGFELWVNGGEVYEMTDSQIERALEKQNVVWMTGVGYVVKDNTSTDGICVWMQESLEAAIETSKKDSGSNEGKLDIETLSKLYIVQDGPITEGEYQHFVIMY